MKKILKLSVIVMALFIGTVAHAQLKIGGGNVSGADAAANLPPPNASKPAERPWTFPLGSDYESGYSVFVWAVKGPARTNPLFDSWSADETAHVRLHKKPRNSLDFKYALQTADISMMTPQNTNEVIWYVVWVERKEWAPQFKMSWLKFWGTSSDTNHYLTTSSSLNANADYTFTPRLRGVLWGSSPGINDVDLMSVADGRISEKSVDAGAFIGQQINYFTYSTSGGYTAIDNYVMGHTNFAFSGGWSLVMMSGESTTNVVAWGNRTLTTKIPPSVPRATIARHAPHPGSVQIGSIGHEEGVTVKLFSRDTITSGWNFEGTFNAGDLFLRTMEEDNDGFFKLEAY